MREETYADYCERMRIVALTVHSNLDHAYSVEELSDVACMSAFHFQRVFKQITGERIGHFARRLRLEKAAWRLQHTNDAISEIALDAGYDALEAFTRAFKFEYGSSAGDFRRAKWLSHIHAAANEVHFFPGHPFRFRALNRDRTDVKFKVVEVAHRPVLARKHLGSPHMLGKTVRDFWAELAVFGLDARSNPMITFSPKLGPNMSTRSVDSYAAADAHLVSGGDYERKTLGGGPHLLTEHIGDWISLGDYWFRIWAEVLPASRCVQRAGFVFQVATYLQSGDCRSLIYLPVLAK